MWVVTGKNGKRNRTHLINMRLKGWHTRRKSERCRSRLSLCAHRHTRLAEKGAFAGTQGKTKSFYPLEKEAGNSGRVQGCHLVIYSENWKGKTSLYHSSLLLMGLRKTTCALIPPTSYLRILKSFSTVLELLCLITDNPVSQMRVIIRCYSSPSNISYLNPREAADFVMDPASIRGPQFPRKGNHYNNYPSFFLKTHSCNVSG